MFREMRLTKQQLPDEEALAILEKGGTGTLALLGDEGYPYSVPVNYMYEDGCIYFHSAKDGHKVDAIARESKASMSVITKDVLMPEKYTTDYCSVIVFGNITLITDDEKKRRMIYSFTKKFCSEYESGIDAEIDGAWNRLHVYELKIEHMTGKRAMP
ncbi:MAG: pyridoxamine 5'-phosphate oxidase family protein [Lachnospiraceae bacterium]|nr:pyridoxamine 5'-phosphate oxidase family protein [Lachnospiraceae bacterium]